MGAINKQMLAACGRWMNVQMSTHIEVMGEQHKFDICSVYFKAYLLKIKCNKKKVTVTTHLAKVRWC